jgi:hypothetical protein
MVQRIEIGSMMPNDTLPMHARHSPDTVDFHFGLYYTMLAPIPHRDGFPLSDTGGPRQNCVPLKKKG